MSDEQEKYQYRKSEINQGTSPTQHKYKGSFTYYVIHFGQFLDPYPQQLCSPHLAPNLKSNLEMIKQSIIVAST